MNLRLVLLLLLASGLGGAYFLLGESGGEETAAPLRPAGGARAGDAEDLRLLDGSSLLSGSPLEGLTLEDFKQTRNRPLFSENRRPPPPEKPAAPPAPVVQASAPPPAAEPPPEAGRFELRGLVFNGPESMILLRDTRSGASLRVRQGDEIDGWRVTAESARAALLVKQGVEERLQLFTAPEEEESQ